uniref:Integrase catalytic domain-containing protein n=1 Tax=Trichogramma kaykai TaxID=54128 RepID=A0ABD2VXU9_9HYME
MGPYPLTGDGNKCLLIVTDLFSHWVKAFPIAATDATTIAAKLESQVFTRWGFLQAILTDNDTQFSGRAWASACKTWQAYQWTTAMYRPQANPTERRNQEVKTALRIHLKGRPHVEWDLQIPKILFQLRNRKNAATGKSPAELLLGRDLLLPGEWKILRQLDEKRKGRRARVSAHQSILEGLKGFLWRPRTKMGGPIPDTAHGQRWDIRRRKGQRHDRACLEDQAGGGETPGAGEEIE